MIGTLAGISWAVFIGTALVLLGILTLTRYRRATELVAYAFLGLLALSGTAGIVFGVLAGTR